MAILQDVGMIETAVTESVKSVEHFQQDHAELIKNLTDMVAGVSTMSNMITGLKGEIASVVETLEQVNELKTLPARITKLTSVLERLDQQKFLNAGAAAAGAFIGKVVSG